jgi:hypothetical protein
MFSCWVRSESALVSTRNLLFVSIFCFTITASAQQRHLVLTNVDSATIWFDRIVTSQSAAIVNGPEYHISFKGLKTHPFYKSAEAQKSSATYENDIYENLDLLYDTYADILVLKTSASTGTFFVKLDKELVQTFELHHHHFKKFRGGPSSKEGAYYDVLFEEKHFAVLVRRIKLEQIEGRERDYVEEDVHYILNNGKWIRLTGKSSFSKTIQKDQRKALTAFIKSNGINLRRRRDEDLAKLGAFCYSLKEWK